jgi:WD40 repeat protein
VVRLWGADGALLREWTDHTSTVADLAWKPGRRELAVAAYGGLTLYDPERDEPRARHTWKGSTLVIAWSPDGKYVATGDQDSTVHFWFSATGQDLQMWGYPTKVRELAWDPGSRFLATGGGPEVTVWDCAGKGPEGTRALQLQAHENLVSALAYQGSGPLLASGGADGLVAVWRPDRGRRAAAQTGFNVGITALAWSPDDRWLAVGTEAGTVALHNAPQG